MIRRPIENQELKI